MTIGDIYQAKFKQTIFGEELLNVFYYRQNGGAAGDGAAELAEGLQGTSSWLQEWAAMQLEDVAYDYIQVINGMNNSDQATDFTIIPDSGAIDSDGVPAAPTLLAVGFRSNRGGVGTRYSYKRLSGFPAYFLDGNGWAAGVDTLAAAVATALAAQVGSGGKTFVPVQVTGGFRLGVTPTESFPLTAWTMMGTPSTQNTRKSGRGS